MELIALRDIQPDEERFLDCGDEWEAAWQDHLSNWKPEPDADQYISADETLVLNEYVARVSKGDKRAHIVLLLSLIFALIFKCN